MLSNAYFLAKFRFDTAENEPAKNLQNFAKIANFPAGPGGVVARTHASRPVAVPCHPGSHGSRAALARTPRDPSGLGQGLRRSYICVSLFGVTPSHYGFFLRTAFFF